TPSLRFRRSATIASTCSSAISSSCRVRASSMPRARLRPCCGRGSRLEGVADNQMTKCLVSWSSGKDSAWMVHVLRQQGVEIAGLLTTINADAARVAMHAVRVTLLDAQAAALGLPLWQVPIPSPCPNEVYERAVADGFTHIAFADLFLADIRRYREDRLAGSGLTPLFPLFDDPAKTPALAREMIVGGLRARITCVDPRQLDRSFAGRDFDARLLR